MAAILGEEPPAPVTPPAATGAAAAGTETGAAAGAATAGLRQRKGKPAVCEIEEVSGWQLLQEGFQWAASGTSAHAMFSCFLLELGYGDRRHSTRTPGVEQITCGWVGTNLLLTQFVLGIWVCMTRVALLVLSLWMLAMYYLAGCCCVLKGGFACLKST